MQNLDMQTPDITSMNIENIAKLFPNVITEKDENGKIIKAIDFDLLKQQLSKELVEDNEERYTLNWPWKKASLLKANTPIEKTLRPCREDSVDFDTTENLYLEWDNFEVLKILQESYLWKVKMIYIDPPYNTGKDFVYRDNFKVSKDEYEEDLWLEDEEGWKLFKNTDTNGRFHSDWLSMMYERLTVARDLLKDDWVIFMSIDDNEVHNLRKIADEIFGEENLIQEIIINRPSEIAWNYTISKHEYILLYSKNFDLCKLKWDIKETLSRWTVWNEWQSMPIITFPAWLKCYWIKDWIYNETRKLEWSSENIENFEPIIVENWKLKNSIKLKAKWRSSNDMRNFFDNWCKPTKAKIAWEIIEIFFENNRFNPQIRKKTNEKISSIYLDNKRWSKSLEILDMKWTFSFPKSPEFLGNFIKFVWKNNIILDFFWGSSSTAHAVMELNLLWFNNKFITVQLDENLDETKWKLQWVAKTAIEKAISFLDSINKPHLITEIWKERIRRAGKKILEENAEKLEKRETPLDTWFRVYKTDSSNMKDVFYHPSELEQWNLLDVISNIKEDRSSEDLLTQVILDLGLTLDMPIEKKEILWNTVYFVAWNSLVACFDENIDFWIVDKIAKEKPLRVVFRDNCFKTDSDRINFENKFKKISGESDIRVI